MDSKSQSPQIDNDDIRGRHYHDNFRIEPWDFFMANHTPYDEAAVCKYVLRHRFKGGRRDLEAAKNCIEKMIRDHYLTKTPAEEAIEEAKVANARLGGQHG